MVVFRLHRVTLSFHDKQDEGCHDVNEYDKVRATSQEK